MARTIRTLGADIRVTERPGGGCTIQQGRSHVLLTGAEAEQLAATLTQFAAQRFRPGRARLLRYTASGSL